MQVAVCSFVEGEGAKTRMSKVVELYVYDQFNKVAMDEVPCGDIVAISGISVCVSMCVRMFSIVFARFSLQWSLGACVHMLFNVCAFVR
jgi:predicted membrane GTPase involved in stress response